MATKKDHTQKSLNLPDKLVELIQLIADEERRSFSAQAILLLEEGVNRHGG